MNTNTTTIATVRGRTAMAVAAAGLAALALAGPASAGTRDQRVAVDCPKPYSQECDAVGAVTVPADGDLFIEFRGDPGACADIIGHFYVNGVEVGTGQTGPGRNNFARYVNGSDVPERDGQYHVTMKADGVLGGCNTGEMSGWAGTLHVETGSDA